LTHSSDEQLRLAYGASLTERTRGKTDLHPTPEALLALAERSGNEAVRLEVLDHVMACETCRRDFDLVRASVVAATPRRRTWFRSPSIGLMAIAATLLVVAGVRLYKASGDSDAAPVLRGGAGVATYPVRWLPNVGAGLAWQPTVGAASYRLEVIDEAGVAVVDSTMRDTTYLVTDSILRSRRGLTWSVTATLAGGSTVTSSPNRLAAPAR
jgi:hypothetical protein